MMARLMVMFAAVIFRLKAEATREPSPVPSAFRRKQAGSFNLRSIQMRNRLALTCALAFVLAGTGGGLAAEDGKAAEVMAAARKAIGDKKLDGVKTLTVEAQVQRNVGAMQMTTETEILLELPDRYLRSDTASGPMGGGMTSGFNG